MKKNNIYMSIYSKNVGCKLKNKKNCGSLDITFNILFNSKISIKQNLLFLLKIIDFLIKNKIVHFDIKPENIICDNKKHLRLIDFGTSLIISDFNKIIFKNDFKFLIKSIVNNLYG